MLHIQFVCSFILDYVSPFPCFYKNICKATYKSQSISYSTVSFRIILNKSFQNHHHSASPLRVLHFLIFSRIMPTGTEQSMRSMKENYFSALVSIIEKPNILNTFYILSNLFSIRVIFVLHQCLFTENMILSVANWHSRLSIHNCPALNTHPFFD